VAVRKVGDGRDLGTEVDALVAAAFITNLGDGLRLAALPLLADSLTDSPFILSTVTAAQFLPWMTTAPFGGLLVDRSERRRLILVTQLWRALLMVGLGVVILTGAVQFWHLWIVAFLITAGENLVDPSVIAMVPRLVDRSDIDRANGRLNTVEVATNDFAGQTLGAVLFGFAPWLPFVLDGLSYGGSIAPFSRLPKAEPDPSSDRDARSIRKELAAGLDWIRQQPFLRASTPGIAVFHLGTGGTLALLVKLVTDVHEGQGFVFGIVLAAAALGATVTSSLAGRLADVYSRRVVVLVGNVTAAATVIIAAASGALWHVVGLWVFNGAAFGVLHSIGRGFVQRHTPDALLGRTAIASRSITRGAFVVGALGIGAFAEVTSVRLGLVAAGVLHLLGTPVIWRSFRYETP